jgi:hypothetical protein
MEAALRQAVRRRAGRRCEYCQLPEARSPLVPFQIEHIVAHQHGGATRLSNLALACHRDNLCKGPNLAGIDPVTRRLVPLFHPRRMKWSRHFRYRGSVLVGRTAIGRATIGVLQMNHKERIDLRQTLIDEGVFPPRGVARSG